MTTPRAVKAVLLCGWLAAVSVVAATAPGIGTAVAAAPVNLLLNGSFETGNEALSPWIFRHDIAATLAVDTTGAVDGTRAAKVTVAAASTSTQVVQLRQESVALHSETLYTVAFWAKASGPRVINARLQSSVDPFQTFVAKDFTLSTAWQRFEFRYISPGDVPNAFVGFNLAQAIGDVELDGVVLTDSNLVSNGGFETGGASLSPWIWRNDIDATLTQDTTVKFAGTASAKITVPTVGSASHLVQLRIPIGPLDPGTTYVVGFEMMASRPRVANVRLQSPDAPYRTVATDDFHVSTAWTRVSFQWTPNVNVTNPFLGFNLAQDTGTVWIDDVSLTQVPSGTITTVAGPGASGFLGDGGPATGATLQYPRGLAVDAAGNLYIADYLNNRVRKVSPSGTISTVAGNGVQGFSGDGGPATNAALQDPSGVAVDAAGNLYIADSNNWRIRKVSPAGTISTVAGGGGTHGVLGDGGPAVDARLFYPYGVAVDAAGNVYIADTGVPGAVGANGAGNRVRKVSTTGTISTVAGNGTEGFSGDGGQATSASLSSPLAVAVDAVGNLYIADSGNHRVRKVSPGGTISTVAGNGTDGSSGDGAAATAAALALPAGVAVDAAGNVYIADAHSNRVRRVSPGGTISTVAGNGSNGWSGDGGAATSAELTHPDAVTLDAGRNLYIADAGPRYFTVGYSRVRRVVTP